LTTVGNLPYRKICKEFGADITCGEMALGVKLLQGSGSEWALTKRDPSEDIFGVQICGSNIEAMTRCAEIINNEVKVDFVDLNCGCPIDLITKTGAGSALTERKRKLEGIVRGMMSVLDVPVTVKMRTGKSETDPTAHSLLEPLSKLGVSAVTMHGRSRLQRYMRAADWEYIKKCAEEARRTGLTFIGNGDIYTWQQCQKLKESSGVDTVMLARGALIKPWLFKEIKSSSDWDISAAERFDMLKRYVNYGLYHWGSDDKGVNTTREFLLQWLSFLYRYIPVGLLERQCGLNERPPAYFGRNDLETLMSSPNVDDWIKISELLLGPVPEGFHFTPKHRSNAYESG